MAIDLLPNKTQRIVLREDYELVIDITSGSVGVSSDDASISETVSASKTFGPYEQDVVFYLNAFTGTVATYDNSVKFIGAQNAEISVAQLQAGATGVVAIKDNGKNLDKYGVVTLPTIESTVANIRADYPSEEYKGLLAFITDVGSSGIQVRSNGSQWVPTSPVSLVVDATTFTRTNTTIDEQVVSTYVIPGWLLGASGRLVIEPVATFANTSSVNKTMRVRMAEYGEDILGVNSKVLTARANTSMTLTAPYCEVINVSETSQKIPYTNTSTFISSGTQAMNTSNIDTTGDVVIAVTLQFAATTPAESGSIEQIVITLEP